MTLLPLNQQVLIDRCCDEFESSFRASGTIPDIAAFVASVQGLEPESSFDESLRAGLVRELLRLHVDLAKSGGGDFDPCELRERYPQFASIIHEAFPAELGNSASGVRAFDADWPLDSACTPEPESRPDLMPARELEPGQTIGPFELLEHLGTGGMGTVWKARQLRPVQREIALKLIRGGRFDFQALARFRGERQALAVLAHPHIARMLEADQTSEGQPYLAMELVDGPSITGFASQHGLALRDRIGLFIPVCRAIQHAHLKGIIHRDLKPSNILVATGSGIPMAKVIDLGLAKAVATPLTDDSLQTRRGQVVGTLDYMSPEQTLLGQSDVDTRSDVYSLGAVLYELLAGARPLDAAGLRSIPMEKALELIRSKDPPLPSTVASGQAGSAGNRGLNGPALRGEPDWIVMKCLEKDPARRYQSAAELADDLERCLDGRAVFAAPRSRSYRVRKFLRRNRGPVLASAVTLGTLVIGLMATLLALNWALRERDDARSARGVADQRANDLAGALADVRSAKELAQKRADELELIAEFQASQLALLDPSAMGVTIRQALLDQEQELAKQDADEREVTEPERPGLAEALVPANFTDVAIAALRSGFYDRTRQLVDSSFASQPTIRCRLLVSLADSARKTGLTETALTLEDAVIELSRKEWGDQHESTLEFQAQRGLLLIELSRHEEAAELLAAIIKSCDDVLPPGHAVAVEARLNAATNLRRLGQYDQAETMARDLVEAAPDETPDGLARQHRARHLLGQTLSELRKFDEAEKLLRENLELARKRLQPSDSDYIASVGEYGLVLDRMRRFEEAEPCLREALELSETHRGRYHPQTLAALNNLASFLVFWRSQTLAMPVLQESARRHREALGPNHLHSLIAEQSVAVSHFHQKQFDQAIPIFESVLAGLERTFGKDHEATLGVMANLAINYRETGRLDEALAMMESVYSRRLQSHDQAFIAKELIETCFRAKRPERAIEIAREELTLVNQRSPGAGPERLLALWPVANWFRRGAEWEVAEKLLRECLVMREQFEAGDWKVFDNQSVLGEVLMEQDRLDEADALLHGGYEQLMARFESIPRSWRPAQIGNALRRLMRFHELRGESEAATQWAFRLGEFEESLKKTP